VIPHLGIAREEPFDQEAKNTPAGGKQRQENASPSTSSLPEDKKLPLWSPGGWQLHRAVECRGRKLVSFEKEFSIKNWLQTHRNAPFAMTAMRRALLEEGLLLPLSRWREEDIIEQVAHLLKSDRWHVCEPVMPVYQITVSQEPVFMPVPRRGPAPSSSPPPPRDIPDEPTLAGNADQNAIAAVLTQAAQDGVPFCEECAKLAAAGKSR
jgi:hypothetical protein